MLRIVEVDVDQSLASVVWRSQAKQFYATIPDGTFSHIMCLKDVNSAGDVLFLFCFFPYEEFLLKWNFIFLYLFRFFFLNPYNPEGLYACWSSLCCRDSALKQQVRVSHVSHPRTHRSHAHLEKKKKKNIMIKTCLCEGKLGVFFFFF